MREFIQSSLSFRTCCDTVVQMRQNQDNPVLLQSSLFGRIMSIVYLFIANQSQIYVQVAKTLNEPMLIDQFVEAFNG